MNAFSNVWKHPRTSAAGILIAVVTVGSALAQQGIGVGKSGSGGTVAIATAVASALLGLLARDPGAQDAGAATSGN